MYQQVAACANRSPKIMSASVNMQNMSFSQHSLYKLKTKNYLNQSPFSCNQSSKSLQLVAIMADHSKLVAFVCFLLASALVGQ